MYSQTFRRNFAFRNTAGYRAFDDEYWVTEFLDVTPPSRVNRGFLYLMHHRRPVVNQAEFSGQVRFGVNHDFLTGWDYQYYAGHTDRRAAANFNTTPMDLYDPVETHVFVNLDDFPITRLDYSTNRTNAIFFQDTLTVLSKVKVVAGGRFDVVRRNNHNNPVTNGMETEGPVTLGESDKFTHRLGLVYQPTVSLDLLANNSSAFRPNFTIQANGLPLEPEYGEQFVLSGRTPRRAPEHTVSFSTSYAFRNGVSLTAGGQLVSSQFINDTNTIEFNGYELIDVGASYTRGRVQYALNLTNVTNRQYWTSSLGNRQLYPGHPFNVLATVRVLTN